MSPINVTEVKRGPQQNYSLFIAIGIIFFIVISYFAFVNLWTDNLWFQSINFGQVFSTRLLTQTLLAIIAGLLMGGLPYLSVWIAMWARPKLAATSANDPAVRLRSGVMKYLKIGALVPSAMLAVMGALAGTAVMPLFLGWQHQKSFGIKDSQFGLDASFFVFTFPWLRSISSFFLTVMVFSFIAALATHFLTGGLKTQHPSKAQGGVKGLKDRYRMSNAAAVQLSIQAALIMICYGCEKLLDRLNYPVTDNGLFTGVGFTEDHARIQAHLIVAIIAFVCAAMFLLNIFWRRWITPVLAVVLMVISSLVISIMFPALRQFFEVRPSEPDKQGPYIAKHIQATRQAFGLNNVEIQEKYTAQTSAEAGQLKADAEALPGIRLMDPAIVDKTFDQLQQVRGFYTFPDVLDIDRYQIDGKPTDTVVAAREIDVRGLPDQNWNNLHTIYTHGYGLAAAYGNRRQAGGEPDWIARDIPPTGKLDQKEARIYYGELQQHFVVVGAKDGQQPIELDTPEGERTNTYSGPGISVGNIFNRALFATKFADMNLLLSDRVHDKSKILYDRTPLERVKKVAPWLVTDADPYATLIDGRIVWVVDGYTTSASYPNSQQVDFASVTRDRQALQGGEVQTESRQVNYIRNAVKATVDAYDGTVKLFAWDDNDPILKTWQEVYPNTVLPKSDIPKDLLQHIRYPQDMFKVQRQILGRYHMTDPQAWYKQSDLWVVPEDPIAAKAADSRVKGAKEAPYYLSIKWPNDQSPVFSLTTVFTPNQRSNLASYMAVVADATSPDYGKFRVLRMSDNKQIDGPGQAFNAMIQDPTVAEKLRPFLNQGSAAASYGNLLTLPLGGGLLYVAPVYTQREGGASSTYPTLRFVIVRFGEHVAIGDTLQAALDQAFQGNAGATTEEHKPTGSPSDPGKPKPDQGTPPAADPAKVKSLLSEAQTAFDNADKALKAGDLSGYASWISKAKAAVTKAMEN